MPAALSLRPLVEEHRRASASLVWLTVPLAAVAVGAAMVVVPLVRGVMLALVIMGAGWAALMPRGWFPRADRPTGRVIRVFIAVRMFMPVLSAVVGGAASQLFTGGADADGYHRFGVEVATDLLLHGYSSSHGTQIPGSSTVALVAGYFYAYGAPVRLLSYYVCNVFAVIGLLLFWWATNDLVAPHLRRAYTAFVLLTPTLLFWNAGLGKEAPLMFATGAVVAGFQLLNDRRSPLRGFSLLICGVVVAGSIRPHIALLLMLSAVAGLVLGGTRMSSGRRRRRIIPLLIIAALGIGLFPLTQRLLDPSGSSSFLDAAYSNAEKTAVVGGRSAFEATPTRSVTDIPNAVVTVLLRPFPWEVRTVPQLLASAEALIIGFLFFRTLLRITRRRMQFPRSPLIVMAGVFVLLFCVAFASLGNFGLLVRERMQVLPFVILLAFAAEPLVRSTVVSRHAAGSVVVAGHRGHRRPAAPATSVSG